MLEENEARRKVLFTSETENYFPMAYYATAFAIHSFHFLMVEEKDSLSTSVACAAWVSDEAF
jgi:hypothetical protein